MSKTQCKDLNTDDSTCCMDHLMLCGSSLVCLCLPNAKSMYIVYKYDIFKDFNNQLTLTLMPWGRLSVLPLGCNQVIYHQ